MMPVEPQEIYTVSQLNAEARFLMEENFESIWLIGELSNLARPSSGHIYFKLKDNSAQINCAFFRNSQRGMDFTPENGQQVLVQANVSIYEARGDFQIIVSKMQLAGAGALQIAFEKLKQKLAGEGLFDEEHKLEFPEIPKHIGVITSPTGAAIRDILRVLQRRFPALPVLIYPSAVQGDQAAKQLAQAIQLANKRQECDVLILARGGGSLEDLWPFNEEIVARAIFASEIPIVTGVGHEVDFTIADFVADQRCATPSAAAEWISPDVTEWQEILKTYFYKISKLLNTKIQQAKLELTHLSKRLQHPGKRLEQQAQSLDQLEQRLIAIIKTELNQRHRMLDAMKRNLDAVSPLNTLKRGYAIITKNSSIITDNKQVQSGDKLKASLATGYLDLIAK